MKTIFVQVDTVNDFMNEDGPMYVPAFSEIRENLRAVTTIGKKNEVQTVNTADWHNKATKEISKTPDWVNTFPAHCMEFTEGAEYIPETKPTGPVTRVLWDTATPEYEPSEQFSEYFGVTGRVDPIADAKNGKDLIIYKDHFGAFEGNPHTEAVLEAISPDRAIVYGVATNVCVDYAVMGLLNRGVEVHYVEDAIATLPGKPVTTLETAEETISKWEALGAKRTTTEDLEALIRE